MSSLAFLVTELQVCKVLIPAFPLPPHQYFLETSNRNQISNFLHVCTLTYSRWRARQRGNTPKYERCVNLLSWDVDPTHH
jgi:hypothetical protein